MSTLMTAALIRIPIDVRWRLSPVQVKESELSVHYLLLPLTDPRVPRISSMEITYVQSLAGT